MSLSRVSLTLRRSRVSTGLQLPLIQVLSRRGFMGRKAQSLGTKTEPFVINLYSQCKCGENQFLIPSRPKTRFASNQMGPVDLGREVYDAEFAIKDSEILQALHHDEVEEKTFIRYGNAANIPNLIPGEKDLIDTELDEFLVEGFPATDSVTANEEAEDCLSAPLDKSNPQIIPAPQRSKDKKKRKANKKATPTTRTLKQEEREEIAKVKRAELEKAGKEASLNKSLLAYLEMCVSTGQLNKAINSLNYYRWRSTTSNQFPAVGNISIFNLLLHAFASKGNYLKVREIFQSILDDKLVPTPQSYAAILECLGRMPPSQNNLKKVQDTMQALKHDGFSLNDLFNRCIYEGNQREVVLEALRRDRPDFIPEIQPPFNGYVCPLLCHLNDPPSNPQSTMSPLGDLMCSERLGELGKKQLNIELCGTITVKSILKKEDKDTRNHFRSILEETEKEWERSIEEAFLRNMNALIQQSVRVKNQKAISLYPFLNVVSPAEIVKIITQEIRKLAEGSETYSPSVIQLHRELGARVLSRYEVTFKKDHGILEKVDRLYQEYIRWYHHPEGAEQVPPIMNSREKWQRLLYDPQTYGPDVDIGEKVWPSSVLSSIGRFLYGVIMRDIKINPHVMKLNAKSKSEQVVPAFYSIFRMQGVQLKEEIKPHPVLVKLFLAASRDELIFDSNLVPMISPPLPWASIRTGGYLLSAAKIIRLPYQAHQQRHRLEQCPSEDLYPSLDSLNQLGSIPWKINQSVLDIVVEVFNNKGDESLTVPPPPSECPSAPPIEPTMTKQEKFKIHKMRLGLKRKKAEMYSLWCDALYKLSLANHFRDDIFWFPHNMDFRGRVYPCPPHLNHLGSDLARSILVFALGQPLGPKGLDWLKIHLVNLTGLKKKESIAERLKFANHKLPDILDSAVNPLTGRRWWAKSEEPWQTLACCMEIEKAMRSGDPESFISHFPVHQDGSCNGLQHYAALGRDQAGAESVNLAPSPIPQDVYSAVASLVEKLRQRDAENGVSVAQVLEGFIKRKVIKQTVMTTVYGVTRYGARLQIAKQLKDIPNFPREHLWPASLYLVGRTFDSLQEMFTSTKEIQDWFTECAKMISHVCGQNVEWVTPLGLPVVQPYFRQLKKTFDAHDPLRLKDSNSYFDMFERPNVMKQKNAFPPNYIHSLDSSHMMLTSLHCEREKMTFVSVHDCFWTHPATVETMNRICREQFVALHSQPILEDLSDFLVRKYSYRESDMSRDGSVIDMTKRQLNRTLTAVPTKGIFNLQSVLQSVYFFS